MVGDTQAVVDAMRAHVVRLDDSLAVALDRETARSAALKEGDSLDVAVHDDRLVLRRARPRYTLDALLAGTTPEDYRAAAVEWGPDLGREAVE